MNSKLINHKNKCRCCLAKFRRRNDKLLITPIIQQKFQDLTRAELKLTDEYSKFICHNCYNELNATDKLRRSIMIESQVKISDYKDLPPEKFNYVAGSASKEVEAPGRHTSIRQVKPEISDKTGHTFKNQTIPKEVDEPATKIHQNNIESDTKCPCCEILINELDELQLD